MPKLTYSLFFCPDTLIPFLRHQGIEEEEVPLILDLATS